jgi:hypothetical protein
VRTARAAWVLLALAAIAFGLAARRGSYGSAELPPHPPPAGAVSPPPFLAKLPPPAASEVKAGLRRAFGETVEPARPSRALVGDFNGDGMEDVAVPVRPDQDRLAELNDGLANWWVQDALRETESDVESFGETSLAMVEAGDLLLAVIHGYGPRGWRDERARQCYLVRHATGAPFEVRPRTALARYVGATPAGAPLPGHVILASAGRRAGFVQWTGARYEWHPLPARARVLAGTPREASR